MVLYVVKKNYRSIETNHISQPGHMTGKLPYCCHGTHHLPDLQYVVFRDTAQHPGFIGVPSEVWNFSCVASMNKLEGEDKKSNNIVFIPSPLMLQLTFLFTQTLKHFVN